MYLLKEASRTFMGSHSGAHRAHPGQVTQHLLYNPKSDTKLSSTTEVPILHLPSPPGSKPDAEAIESTPLVRPRKNLSS